MMFLDSPSQLAPSSEWRAWRIRLNALNPHDRTVVAEKLRADRLLALLLEEEALDRQTPAPPPLSSQERPSFTLEITAIHQLPEARIAVIEGMLLTGTIQPGCDAELVQGDTRTAVRIKSVVLGSALASGLGGLSITVDIHALPQAVVGDRINGMPAVSVR